jgi:hypothetical protein
MGTYATLAGEPFEARGLAGASVTGAGFNLAELHSRAPGGVVVEALRAEAGGPVPVTLAVSVNPQVHGILGAGPMNVENIGGEAVRSDVWFVNRGTFPAGGTVLLREPTRVFVPNGRYLWVGVSGIATALNVQFEWREISDSSG